MCDPILRAMHRRDAIPALLAGLVAPAALHAARRVRGATDAPDFAALERRVAGRLGVAVLDVATERRLAYRADERFPMCSTFKWLLGAQILVRAATDEDLLRRVVPYGSQDLMDYAPVTRAHASDGGMSVSDLAAAAIEYSDNTAANLLLQLVGGPASLTGFLRQLGDDVTRLDRIEPELNSAVPGDPRDTTTPDSMLSLMHQLLVGEGLGRTSRDQLITWLVGSTTGAEKLRAGLPPGWRVGDKTGMGAHGSTNDVAIVWVTERRPVLIAAYLTESAASAADRNNVLARVGSAVAGWMTGA